MELHPSIVFGDGQVRVIVGSIRTGQILDFRTEVKKLHASTTRSKKMVAPMDERSWRSSTLKTPVVLPRKKFGANVTWYLRPCIAVNQKRKK
jgi:hypothetical protein